MGAIADREVIRSENLFRLLAGGSRTARLLFWRRETGAERPVGDAGGYGTARREVQQMGASLGI